MDQSQQYSTDAAASDAPVTNGTPSFGLGVNPSTSIVTPGDPQAPVAQTDDSTVPTTPVSDPAPVSLPTAPQITTTHEPNAMATNSSDANDTSDTHDNGSSDSGPSDEPPVVVSAPNPVSATVASGDLEDIKKQALEELSPLVNQLDQSPEERYKTLMMLIQASDNDSLLNEAYTAAQKITDEKARAEALLNIVNEINYFAQKNASN